MVGAGDREPKSRIPWHVGLTASPTSSAQVCDYQVIAPLW